MLPLTGGGELTRVHTLCFLLTSRLSGEFCERMSWTAIEPENVKKIASAAILRAQQLWMGDTDYTDESVCKPALNIWWQ